jgi:hypothetical protein
MSTTETNPKTLASDWRNKLLRNWANMRLGHEGMMLDKITRQNRIVEVLARNAATGDVSDVSGWPEGDDMGVNIGNEIHYHGGNPAPVQPMEKTPAPTASKVLPWILAAAAALGGAGLTSVLLDREPAVKPSVVAPVDFPQYDVEKWVP